LPAKCAKEWKKNFFLLRAFAYVAGNTLSVWEEFSRQDRYVQMTDKTDRIFGNAPKHQTPQPRRAAYVVVTKGRLIAAVRRGSIYFLPGGGAEVGESPVQNVMREVSEELECEIRIDREIGKAVQYFYSDDDQVHYEMSAAFFTGRFTSEPGGEICWVSEVTLKDALFHECHRWAVEEASHQAS